MLQSAPHCTQVPRPGMKTVPLAALLLAALALPAPATRAAEVEDSWSYVDERPAAERPGGRQARASIYRGDHLVAVRCYDDGEQRWESLLVGATWFGHPKAKLTFELAVDGQPPITLVFRRETDYRFAGEPPPQLLRQLMEGSRLTIGGPDFVGDPILLPLTGSRDALAGAFQLCGYDPVGEQVEGARAGGG